jgi:crossover junction endodeoxyribonuclease RuvC
MSEIVYAGVDPGMHGAVAFLENGVVSVFDPPLMKKSGKANKDKKDYDIKAMAEILRKYNGKKVVFLIEAVFSMTGQGVSSSFNFGRGKGIWEGLAHAFEFDVHMVSPQTWKKDFDGLIQHKEKLGKDTTPKSAKEKKAEATEAAKQKRLAKAAAKEKARELAGKLCPQLKDRFKTVNSDGRAEAVLIVHYAEKHYGVQ